VSKIALVTGGAQGIGKACAQKLLELGFEGVVLLDRNVAALELAAQQLSKFGKTEYLSADLRDEATPAKAVAFTISKFGRIDVLINAAGSTARGGVGDTTRDTLSLLLDVNVKAPFFLMQEASRHMVAQGHGTIINIASMIGYGGPPNLGAYSASKAALMTITKHAAQEFAWQGVRSYCVNLGWALTEGERETQTKVHGFPDNWFEDIGSKMPAGRLILPSDIADLCAYLISPSAQMMNGAVIDFEQIPVGMFRNHPVLKSS
jgi:NAD(P)-dependent dehydrogenase (short-subunit alcohol dehydrogenase family)